jgi:PAS domain S-box-containing protein
MVDQIFNPFTLMLAAAAGANFILILIISVREKQPSNAFSWFYILMGISCIWSCTNIALSIVTTPAVYGFWYAFTELMVSLLLPVFTCFVLSFTGRDQYLKKPLVLYIIFLPALVLLYLYWRTEIVTLHDFSQVIKTPWGLQYPRASLMIDIYAAGIYIFFNVYMLITYFLRTKEAVARRAIVLVFVAMLLPFFGGMVFQGIIPTLYPTIGEFPAASPLLFVTCIVLGVVLLRSKTDVFSLNTISMEIIQIIPESLVVLDAANTIQTVNPSFVSLIGIPLETIIGKPFCSVISHEPERQFCQKNIIDKLIAGQEVGKIETVLTKADGSQASVHIDTVVKKSTDGKILSSLIVITDISTLKDKEQEADEIVKRAQEQTTLLEDNKKAMLNLLEDSRMLEQTLKVERDRATVIVSSISEGLFMVDTNYNILLMNPMAEKMLGLDSKNIVGQNLGKVTQLYKKDKELPPESRPLMQTLKTGVPSSYGLEDDMSVKTASGVRIPIALSTSALRHGEEVTGALVTFHDISRDKQMKETIEETVEKRTMQLKEEQARLTASINSLELGFILTDVDGAIASKNPAASSILNLPWGIKTLTDVDNILHAPFSLVEMHKKSRDERKPTDKRNLSFAGKFIDLFVAPIYVGGRDEDFIGSAILIQDQTEAKVLERSRDEFFSIASHELRTPLTAIRGNTSLIQEHYSEKLEPELKEMVSDIHDSSVRLIDIVNDFLNMGRLEQQRATFKNEPFAIDDLISRAVREYEVTGSRQNLLIQFEKPASPLPKAFADQDRVRQILINLIGNSLKFTSAGSIIIKAAVVDNMIEVSVIDTGRGIPLNNQALLFHKFQQAGDSLFTRDTTKGTGLGLYISKLMIEGMGGKIWLVKSEEGKGSTFAFTVPIAKV